MYMYILLERWMSFTLEWKAEINAGGLNILSNTEINIQILYRVCTDGGGGLKYTLIIMFFFCSCDFSFRNSKNIKQIMYSKFSGL